MGGSACCVWIVAHSDGSWRLLATGVAILSRSVELEVVQSLSGRLPRREAASAGMCSWATRLAHNSCFSRLRVRHLLLLSLRFYGRLVGALNSDYCLPAPEQRRLQGKYCYGNLLNWRDYSPRLPMNRKAVKVDVDRERGGGDWVSKLNCMVFLSLTHLVVCEFR